MKKNLKKIMFDPIIITALLIYPFAFLLSFFVFPVHVSAAENNFPDTKYASNMGEAQAKLLIQQFYDNSTVIAKGFNEYNSIICISYNSYSQRYDILSILGGEYSYQQTRYYNRGWYDAYSYIIDRSKNDKYIYCQSVQNISSFDFSINSTELYSDGYTYVGINFCPNYNNWYYCKYINPTIYSPNYYIYNYPSEFTSYIYNDGYIPPYVSPSNTIWGLDLSINETSFKEWLIENNKISELPSYIGISKLGSFISFYNKFGSNRGNFINNISDWFSYMNIANQTEDNVNILKSIMDALYQEYLHSFWVEVNPHFTNLPHHRRNIVTQTTDTDTTLITDDSNDTTDISILRDILRGIISINNSLCDGVVSFINAFDSLDFTVNVANGGGLGLTSGEIWGSGDITESNNYQTLVSAFENRGVDISAVENLKYNYLEGATQKESFTVSVVMPDTYSNGEFSSKIVTHTIDNNSKMYNTLVLFRKLIAFVVIIYYAIRLRFALPQLIRGE